MLSTLEPPRQRDNPSQQDTLLDWYALKTEREREKKDRNDEQLPASGREMQRAIRLAAVHYMSSQALLMDLDLLHPRRIRAPRSFTRRIHFAS